MPSRPELCPNSSDWNRGMRYYLPLAWIVSWSLVSPLPAAEQAAQEISADDLKFFEEKVRPVLAENCFECHGPKKQQGSLRLDAISLMLKGGDSGAAVVPKKPDESLMIQAVRYSPDGYQMPPKGKLKQEWIEVLENWVARGAPWPKHDVAVEAAAGEAFDLQARKAKQWAFQPVRRPPVPAAQPADWPRSPIDHFILSSLNSAGMKPAPPADKRTWLRRVTFDLIGLPPTPDEIAIYLADDTPTAEQTVVERLLASPHYGERWARHWLDLMRFAETAGHEFDFEISEAWRYRDYVIRAFNDDIPYDQFILEHLAGDLLPQPRRHATEGHNESLLGTGFLYLGEGKHSPVDIREEEATRLDNQIDVIGRAFQAVTLNCARCHDHKFDALSTKDYYALAGYLISSRQDEAFLDSSTIAPLVSQFTAHHLPLDIALRSSALENRTSTLSQFPSNLLAARSVLRKEMTEAQAAEKLADAARFPALLNLLKDSALKQADHPLHLWALLCSSNTRNEEEFAKWRASALQNLKGKTEAQSAWQQASPLFEDFSNKNFEGWYLGGEAFGNGPTQEVQFRLPFDTNAPPSFLKAGMAHSGQTADRLQGVLRSQTFVLEKPAIFYLGGGKNVKVNLIIDGFQRIRNPIYGGLTFSMEGPLKWHRQDVSMWKGHRAYIEVLDEGDGFAMLDEVRFGEHGPPPPAPLAFHVECLQDEKLTSAELLAKRLTEFYTNALQNWATGKPNDLQHVTAWLLEDAAVWGTVPWPKEKEWQQQAEVGRRLEKQIPKHRRALTSCEGTPVDEFVFIRGNHKNPGEAVPRRFLEALDGPQHLAPATSSGRLELARQIASPANPLTARVMVHRIWQHHFGEGIVRTPDDFGNMGQPPTHPELLDWLASEFVKQGWSIKQMHRLMLLSSTYRMSSQGDHAADEADPQNKLLHRMPVRRLEAEAIRDAILAVSGRLDRSLYGPSVMPHLTPHMLGRGRPGRSGPVDSDGRRTIYINVRRNFLSPMLLAFDFPQPFSAIGRRNISNVPAQALSMMNNAFVVQQAGLWSKRVLSQADQTPEERISEMYVSAYGRPPRDVELKSALQFISSQSQQYAKETTTAGHPQAWADLAHVLLNVKEFIFIP